MAEIYKFFNAVETSPGVFDREYVESDFADFFGSLLSTGLLSTEETPGMKVSVEAGTLNTIVSAGKAMLKGHMYENTTPLTLVHAIPEASLDRIDRIVLRLDVRNQSRYIKAFVLEGTPSATPAPPDLQRDNFIHEISLAQVRVRKNTVQLLPADLIDERLQEDLCGIVTWLPKVPTSQFQDQWDEFMAGIEDDGFASAADFATHKADYIHHTGYAIATGSANAYNATLTPALSEYKEGVSLRLKINVANTGVATVNVNGLGAKTIKKQNGNPVTAGNLKAGLIYTLAYDGVSFIQQGEGGEYGNATPADVKKGVTFGMEDGVKVGTYDAYPPGAILPSSKYVEKVTIRNIVSTINLHSIAVDKDDNVIYGDGDRGLYKVNSEGVNMWTITLPSYAANYIKTDGSGNIYILANTILHKYKPTGALEWTYSGSVLNSPTGLAIDSQGNVYVSAVGGNHLTKVTPTGAFVYGKSPYTAMTDIDIKDDVIITSHNDGRVTKFGLDGLSTWSQMVSSYSITKIALGENGGFYITFSSTPTNEVVTRCTSTGTSVKGVVFSYM